MMPERERQSRERFSWRLVSHIVLLAAAMWAAWYWGWTRPHERMPLAPSANRAIQRAPVAPKALPKVAPKT